MPMGITAPTSGRARNLPIPKSPDLFRQAIAELILDGPVRAPRAGRLRGASATWETCQATTLDCLFDLEAGGSPRGPRGRRPMKAHIIGGGFGGLAAAALLIRNAGVSGADITIYEA